MCMRENDASDQDRAQRSGGAEAPIEIASYDPAWPALFRQESDELTAVLAPWLVRAIEHIGSTAVPGLSAKPVIDMMAAVVSLESARPAITAAARLGYCYFPYRPDLEHWFCKPSASHRTHHLHLVPADSAQWIRCIAFREYLRANPDVAAEYAELKGRLAERFRLDREAYTKAKAPFIDCIVEKAIAVGSRPHVGPA
jgi:GrpB-like predicted nucleotidyltransferase (UPF0157 family)